MKETFLSKAAEAVALQEDQRCVEEIDRMKMKPLDNEYHRVRNIWTDADLEKELGLLNAAIQALEALGDRYDVVLTDLRLERERRIFMKRARERKGE